MNIKLNSVSKREGRRRRGREGKVKGGRQREKQKDREGEIIQYNHMIVTYSSHACTPVLVGMASSVSEILLLSKTAKFPFPKLIRIGSNNSCK